MSVVTSSRQGAVGVVSINSPPVNALSHAVRSGIVQELAKLKADRSVKAVVLWCDGRTFVAGADITEFGKPSQAPILSAVIAELEAMPVPVVAAIHGTALAAGWNWRSAVTIASRRRTRSGDCRRSSSARARRRWHQPPTRAIGVEPALLRRSSAASTCRQKAGPLNRVFSRRTRHRRSPRPARSNSPGQDGGGWWQVAALARHAPKTGAPIPDLQSFDAVANDLALPVCAWLRVRRAWRQAGAHGFKDAVRRRRCRRSASCSSKLMAGAQSQGAAPSSSSPSARSPRCRACRDDAKPREIKRSAWSAPAPWAAASPCASPTAGIPVTPGRADAARP